MGDIPNLDHPQGPLVVEFDVPPMVAVGEVPWGLSPWFPHTLRRDADHCTAGEIFDTAGDRPLVLVLRDAHRHPRTQALVSEVCHARPDSVVVDMGIPVWQPPVRAHIRSYGAARVNAECVAELLLAHVAAPVH